MRGLTVRVQVVALVAVGLVMFGAPLAAVQNPPASVPEINGASLSTGLALLSAGALWLRSRRVKK